MAALGKTSASLMRVWQLLLARRRPSPDPPPQTSPTRGEGARNALPPCGGGLGGGQGKDQGKTAARVPCYALLMNVVALVPLLAGCGSTPPLERAATAYARGDWSVAERQARKAV